MSDMKIECPKCGGTKLVMDLEFVIGESETKVVLHCAGSNTWAGYVAGGTEGNFDALLHQQAKKEVGLE